MMKKMSRKMAAAILTGTMILSLMGCQNAKEDNQASSKAAETPKAVGEEQPGTTELSMFVQLDPKTAASRKSLSEVPAVQEIEKRTGITIEFLHPAGNDLAEQLSLILAANDLPDLFSVIWNTIPGGVDKLYNSGQIIDLSGYIDTDMPNFKKLMDAHPEIKTQMVTDDGKVLMLPELRLEESTQYFECFFIRNDWLEAVGKETPTTIDELHDVLLAFKTQDPNGNGKQDEIPFVSGSDQPGVERLGYLYGINTAWAASNCMYVEEGKVKFGPAEETYRDYLTTMNQWYKEGLIDPDYLSSDASGRDAKITSEVGGMFYGKMNGQQAVYLGAMADQNPDFDLVALPYVNAPDAKAYDFNSTYCVGVSGIAISAQCEDVKTALKFVDYLYSDEGNMISNFGIEGDTYEMVDGIPKYTEKVTKNEEGLSLVQSIAKYTIGGIQPRMINDINYWDAVMTYPQQKTVYESCSKATRDRMLPLVSLTTDESTEVNGIFADLKPYIQEMTNKFIMGDIDLSEFDSYIDNVKSMNIDTAVADYQAAYDRFVKR